MLSLILYIGGWKLLSVVIGQSIILPGPEFVLMETLRVLGSYEAWEQIGATSIRALSGFFFSLTLGVSTGLVTGRFKWAEYFSLPFLVSIRSIPVLSFILIAIIWFPTQVVPVFICFLIAYPVITAAVAAGVRQVDQELLEMAAIYGKSQTTILKEIVFPSILPFLRQGIATALGLTWKSVVAAEILSMPQSGVGTAMQTAQLHLDTTGLFAWTLIVVLLAGTSEALLKKGEKKR